MPPTGKRARSKNHMARYREGLQASREGKPKTANPYGKLVHGGITLISSMPSLFNYWKWGWEDGQKEKGATLD